MSKTKNHIVKHIPSGDWAELMTEEYNPIEAHPKNAMTIQEVMEIRRKSGLSFSINNTRAWLNEMKEKGKVKMSYGQEVINGKRRRTVRYICLK